MTRVLVRHASALPDPVLLARCRKSPELGPKILFFSGGTALRGLSRELVSFTHNSIHLITPFDSGGSSAVLRKAFRMPAVGDIRNRLMALADRSLHGNPEIVALFAHRLPKDGDQDETGRELARMARGRHPLVAGVPDPMRKIIRTYLFEFLERVPADFDLRGASIGNLVLAAGYLANRRHLDPIIHLFSMLVRVLGVVRPVVNKDLHLAAKLADGTVLAGQHRLSGKEAPPVASPIERIWLTKSPDSADPVEAPPARDKLKKLIREADLICYPMGSFYSSLLACLLPRGISEAIAANPCPKVFVPNAGRDPELLGHDLGLEIERLLAVLTADDPTRLKPEQVLNSILIDRRRLAREPGLDRKGLALRGLSLIPCELISAQSAPLIDDTLLARVLVSLA